MTAAEKWAYFYSRGWATKAQLQQVVSFGVLTAAEYETITGEPYVA